MATISEVHCILTVNRPNNLIRQKADLQAEGGGGPPNGNGGQGGVGVKRRGGAGTHCFTLS